MTATATLLSDELDAVIAQETEAFDTNPPTSGQVTTAVAMGDNLLARLQKAGIDFDVVD